MKSIKKKLNMTTRNRVIREFGDLKCSGEFEVSKISESQDIFEAFIIGPDSSPYKGIISSACFKISQVVVSEYV